MQRRIMIVATEGGNDMKRVAAVIAAFLLALSITGCGQTASDEGQASTVGGLVDRMPRVTVSL